MPTIQTAMHLESCDCVPYIVEVRILLSCKVENVMQQPVSVLWRVFYNSGCFMIMHVNMLSVEVQYLIIYVNCERAYPCIYTKQCFMLLNVCHHET